MIHNNDRFVEAANEFLFERGYARRDYFIGGMDIDFYPQQFYNLNESHPNGKEFSAEIKLGLNYEKYKHWICEILEPLMVKYNINKEDIK